MSMIKLPPKEPRKVLERDLLNDGIVAMNRIKGVRAVRNNVGMLEDARGVPVYFGLGVGSPDIVGVITFGGCESAAPELAHLPPFGVAFGVEIKKPGKYASKNQRAWHGVAKRRGVPCIVARSGEECAAFVQGIIVHMLETFAPLAVNHRSRAMANDRIPVGERVRRVLAGE